MTEDEEIGRLLTAIHEIAEYDIDEWGTGGIGVALVRKYYADDDPWVTVDELAAQLPLSAAQVRRRLSRLHEEGKVVLMRAGGAVLYSASPRHAQAACDFIKSQVSLRDATKVP